VTSNITRLVSPPRQERSWVDTLLDFTDHIGAPVVFRRWAAISAIAGALERKVWIQSQREKIFPNLYVFLAGPPGTGKTRALMACRRVWEGLGTHHVSQLSLTKAAFIDTLAKAKKQIRASGHYEIHSLLVAIPELGVLLPGYDSEFMNTLTHLYDCLPYSESRRTNKEGPLSIENTVVNLIACTTPGFLVNAMPVGAWNEGFMSRVTIIYNDATINKPFGLLDEETVGDDPHLRAVLQTEMKRISDLEGRIGWTSEAAKLAEHFNELEFKDETEFPAPAHPRLLHYNTRRPVHFLKLCLISSVDRGALEIDTLDCHRARDWMLEAEKTMPEIFHQMASGGDSQTINDCWHFVLTRWHRLGKKGVPVTDVREFLYTRSSAQHVERLIQSMVDMKMVKMVSSPAGSLVEPRAYMSGLSVGDPSPRTSS
jgi:hypothetical protein